MSDTQAGCWHSLLGSLSRKTTKPSKSAPVSDSSLSGTESLPEYVTYATSCDFCGLDAKGYPWPSDKPPTYSSADVNDIFRPEVMKTIEETVDALSPELRKLSLKIHDHPEIGFEEKYAHDTLTAFMSSHGFKVTKHYLGLETAWRAEYSRGTGGRVLGVNSEMDALPGIGHACGHNLIAIAGVGVALAVKAALEIHKIPGKIILLGTPAEEGGNGKVILIDRGGYKDMDVCIMCHPGPGPAKSVGVGSSLAVQSIEVEYFGHTAHASAAPWEAKNALDAAFLSYSNISVLRQQIKPDHRVHGIVEGKNWAANIIPDYAKMKWLVRAPTWDELVILRSRIKACLEFRFRIYASKFPTNSQTSSSAAALATGCKHQVVFGSYAYDLRQNDALAKEFSSIIGNRYGYSTNLSEGAIGGSTDFGNVTYELPSIHPSFAIPTKLNGGNHTALFTEAARTKEAHEICLTITKSLALTGVRVIDDDSFYTQVKNTLHHD